ncbi:MAG: hypothetical protein A2W35_12005 [Chloroflexi bacterium RBG_16_57_11]|nr:MAG: hypothetical protein A2W35_12005 [Chloroflexi bacterium RBG_16_57_11]
MAVKPKIMDYGTLRASSDSWLLVREHVQPLHIPFDFDTSMEGTMVSVIGKMGKPKGSPDTRLIAERMVSHKDIAARAKAIHQSGQGVSAQDDWLRAERELLGG